MNSIQALKGNSLWARRRYFPAINWGAIVAGIVVGMATQSVLALLGVAAGLSTIDLIGNATNAPTVVMWVSIWQATSMLVTAFVGGYVAARMSGLQRNGDGMLHGLVAWGATTLLVALFATSALGALSTEGFPADSRSVAPVSTAGAAWMQAPSTTSSQYVLDLHARPMGEIVPTQGSNIALPPAAERPGSAVSWWAFGAAALSMLLGIAGGFAGVAGARRNPYRLDARRRAGAYRRD